MSTFPRFLIVSLLVVTGGFQVAFAQVSLTLEDGVVEIFGASSLDDVDGTSYDDRATDVQTIPPMSLGASGSGSTSTGGVDGGTVMSQVAYDLDITDTPGGFVLSLNSEAVATAELIDGQEALTNIAVAPTDIGNGEGRSVVFRLASTVGPVRYNVLQSDVTRSLLSITPANEEDAEGGIDLITPGATGLLEPGDYFLDFYVAASAGGTSAGFTSQDARIDYQLQFVVPEPAACPALLFGFAIVCLRRRRHAAN